MEAESTEGTHIRTELAILEAGSEVVLTAMHHGYDIYYAAPELRTDRLFLLSAEVIGASSPDGARPFRIQFRLFRHEAAAVRMLPRLLPVRFAANPIRAFLVWDVLKDKRFLQSRFRAELERTGTINHFPDLAERSVLSDGAIRWRYRMSSILVDEGLHIRNS